MPVRSLSSAVLKWPDRECVLGAARRWARELRARDADVVQVLLVGSYARGDWGVGSDADIIVILGDGVLSPQERYRRYYPDNVPVAVDLWVYTLAEWNALSGRSPRLRAKLEGEWIDLTADTYYPGH